MVRWFTILGILLAFVSGCRCGKDAELGVPATVDADLGIVEAHTAGQIGRDEPIRVVLTPEVVAAVRGEDGQMPALDGVLAFTPAVSGQATWTADNEITFVPDAPLPNGQVVHVEVGLSRLGGSLKDADFSFNVEVRPQTYKFVQQGLAPTQNGTMKLSASVVTGDPADDAAVERMVTARYAGATRELTWTHESPTRHHFVIEGLPRGEGAQELQITLRGEPIGATDDADRVVRVPAKGRFDVTDVVPVTEGAPRIEVRFSDLLDPDQDLRGLVTVAGLANPRLVVEGESIGVYVGDRPSGTFDLTVQGVKNREGATLAEPLNRKITFGPQDPSVRFGGHGVILPRSSDLTVPIEVRNVGAVWVEAIAVPQSNLPQFLQINDLDGDQQMRRVGRTVWRKHIELPQGRADANRWRRVGLDLADFVEAHPAGLYQLSLRFLPQDVVYECSTRPESVELPIDEDYTDDESSNWDPYDTFGWDYDYWQNRENPCHIGFFINGPARYPVTRNVAVSDLGVTVKRGADEEVFVAVTDLVTAEPVADAMVTLLDYQTQPVGKGATNAQGIVRLAAERKPLVAMAERGLDRTLVRLADGGALSTAHFDAGGVEVQKGLRAMIYGERGVWRPGDDIHLTLLRFDRTGQLPSAHPVEFVLTDPLGKVVDKRVVPGGPDGFTPFETRTRDDAMTGPYVVTAKIGGSTFTRTVRVETIKPNRLKIDLDLGTERIDGPNPVLDGTLSARWLFGAPAPDLRTNIEVRFKSRATSFPKYSEYAFSDPSRYLDTSVEPVFEGRLDSEGATAVKTPLQLPSEAPGMLNATFTTRVFEPSGNASIDEVTVPVSPHARYVGIKIPKGDAARGMLLTDKAHRVDIALVDDDGKPLSGAHDVEVQVYKIQWRWWWETDDGYMGDFARQESHRMVVDKTIRVNNGAGTFDFQVDYPEWGRFLVVARDVGGTHRASRPFYIDWPGWAGRARKDGPGGATVLSVSAAQSDVEVGEQVTINIPAAARGRALVSLETSTHVVDAEWIELTGEDRQYTFRATETMVPTVYANVTLVQPHQGTASDLPIRMYGIAPIGVTSPNTKLKPTISTKDTFRPESTVDVTIAETDGHPMTYTLAMVDEGLLGITRFQTPDPHARFHEREALGVRTWDAFGDVAGAYGGALESVIAIGGDGEGANPPSQKARRFPPVVMVTDPVTLGKGQKHTHRLVVPEYIGEVRLMVVAAKDGRFGNAERSVKVKAPVMVASTLPRVLGPQEQIDLPVNVWLMDDNAKAVDLTVDVQGPVSVTGPASRRVPFGGPGESLVQFGLTTGGVGLARITVTAKAGKETATQTTEIDVRPSTETESRTLGDTAPMAPGDTRTMAVTAFGIEGTRDAVLEVSKLPPIDLDRRLGSLIGYPHGCAEQTTSRAFPQVMLRNLVELTPKQSAEIDKNVRAAIGKLQGFQTADGGFSLWPQGHYDAWVSNWAGHFLVSADRAGYRVSDATLLSWMDHQTNQARRWQPGDQGGWHGASELVQAYRLYTLALAGDPEMGAMNRLKSRKDLPEAARWRLAAAYALASQPEAGRALVDKLTTEVSGPTELGGIYHSPTRERAMILETLAILEPSSARTTELMKALSAELAGSAPLSTQATAFSLVAIARLGEELKSSAGLSAEVTIGGQRQSVATDRPLAQVKVPFGPTGSTEVVVKNTGKGSIYARVINQALSEPGKEVALNRGLRLRTEYKTPGGQPVDVSRADHGMDFVAHVTIENTSSQHLSNVALSAIFPSGWELHGQSSGPAEGIDYKEVRDDRVNLYMDLNRGASKTFVIALNAAYRGRFYHPQFTAEAMYDPNIATSTRGRWVEVDPSAPVPSKR